MLTGRVQFNTVCFSSNDETLRFFSFEPRFRCAFPVPSIPRAHRPVPPANPAGTKEGIRWYQRRYPVQDGELPGTNSPIYLRPYCAMPGTDTAYGGTSATRSAPSRTNQVLSAYAAAMEGLY
eukprot:1387533-Rhodomonas_salina.2